MINISTYLGHPASRSPPGLSMPVLQLAALLLYTQELSVECNQWKISDGKSRRIFWHFFLFSSHLGQFFALALSYTLASFAYVSLSFIWLSA